MSVSTICYNCARGWCNHGTPNPAATWRVGECGVCRQTQPVTEPSVWGGMKPDWADPTPHHGETLNGGAVWRLREWERIFRENEGELRAMLEIDGPIEGLLWDASRMMVFPQNEQIRVYALHHWLKFVKDCEARDALGRRDNDH